jgi:hypothetical protein
MSFTIIYFAEYNIYAAINKAFNDAYRNIEVILQSIPWQWNDLYFSEQITYSQIVEVPNVNGTKINDTYAEGNVGAGIHWQGDYIHGYVARAVILVNILTCLTKVGLAKSIIHM